MHKVMLPINSRAFRRFNLEEVIYLKAEGNYSRLIRAGNREVLLCVLLRQVEEKLHQKGFYRLNRNCLINLEHIKEYRLGHGPVVVMSDNTCIEIPRRNKKVFRELMKEHFTHL